MANCRIHQFVVDIEVHGVVASRHCSLTDVVHDHLCCHSVAHVHGSWQCQVDGQVVGVDVIDTHVVELEDTTSLVGQGLKLHDDIWVVGEGAQVDNLLCPLDVGHLCAVDDLQLNRLLAILTVGKHAHLHVGGQSHPLEEELRIGSTLDGNLTRAEVSVSLFGHLISGTSTITISVILSKCPACTYWGIDPPVVGDATTWEALSVRNWIGSTDHESTCEDATLILFAIHIHYGSDSQLEETNWAIVDSIGSEHIGEFLGLGEHVAEIAIFHGVDAVGDRLWVNITTIGTLGHRIPSEGSGAIEVVVSHNIIDITGQVDTDECGNGGGEAFALVVGGHNLVSVDIAFLYLNGH